MAKQPTNYEQAIRRLEEIVAKIQNGQADIDTLADSLKEAKQLLQFCKGKLTAVQDEVNKILDENNP